MYKQIMAFILSLSLYLGLHNGYLALWKDNSNEPVRIYPYHISLYPKLDKELLEKGVPIASESEFSQRIEDYLS